MDIDDLTLSEIGELRLIEQVVLPLAQEYGLGNIGGDDCAYIDPGAHVLAVTADVGPKPLLHSLSGYSDDLEAAGWLAVVTTASDVATTGATPLFLTNCIDAPPNLSIRAFRAYLRGFFSACAFFGFANGGGDVRHGPTLSIRVFGAGTIPSGVRIGRGGAMLGDRLVLIGPAGELMAAYLLAAAGHTEAIRDGKLLPEYEAILRQPQPRIREMQALVGKGLITSASDTSDGLIGAIDNLARASSCGFLLELDETMFSRRVGQAATASGFSPWNIYFAWGDWSVAATVPTDRFEEFEATCSGAAIGWTPLGIVTSRARQLQARMAGGDPLGVNIIRNENFVSRGFNAGLEGHLNYLLGSDLFVPR